MAVAVGQIIVYQDLVNLVINTILSQCQNIDSWKSSVPAQLRGTYSRTITGTTTTQVSWDGKGAQTQPQTVTTRATIRTSDSALQLVSSNTVRSQFNSFMSSRGIASKAGTIMTLRGILNFIVNAAAFIKCKVITVGSSDTTTVCVFYNQNDNSYGSVTAESSGVDNDTWYRNTVSDMLNSLNNTSRFHAAQYSIAVSCCSSSSSSCSSSCSSSSSSSSSSSVFIAYMKI